MRRTGRKEACALRGARHAHGRQTTTQIKMKSRDGREGVAIWTWNCRGPGWRAPVVAAEHLATQTADILLLHELDIPAAGMQVDCFDHRVVTALRRRHHAPAEDRGQHLWRGILAGRHIAQGRQVALVQHAAACSRQYGSMRSTTTLWSLRMSRQALEAGPSSGEVPRSGGGPDTGGEQPHKLGLAAGQKRQLCVKPLYSHAATKQS